MPWDNLDEPERDFYVAALAEDTIEHVCPWYTARPRRTSFCSSILTANGQCTSLVMRLVDRASRDLPADREAMRFHFNERKTAQAAAHLLKLSGGRLNYMQLIKLLFLADRRALVENGQPITGASMVSMNNGPVLSQVLDLVNGEGSDGSWAAYVSSPSNYEVTLNAREPDNDEMSRFELRLLGEVYARFGKMDKWDLVRWLHYNIPEWRDPKGSVLSIEFADVLRANDVPEDEIQRIREQADLQWAIGALGQ